MTFDTTAVTVFVLALARTSAWVVASPLFSAYGIAGVGRRAFAMAMAVAATPIALAGPPPPEGIAAFVAVVAGNIALGLVLGWITGLALAIFQSAGSMIDLTSGFSVGTLLDPITGSASAVMSRLFGVAFVAIFFASDAYQVVAGAYLRTFEASAPTQVPVLGADTTAMAAQSMSELLLAALEIAAPLLGALLLAEVALALAARFVPQANIFLIGLPLKIGITLALVGSTLLFFPVYAERVVDTISRMMLGVSSQ